MHLNGNLCSNRFIFTTTFFNTNKTQRIHKSDWFLTNCTRKLSTIIVLICLFRRRKSQFFASNKFDDSVGGDVKSATVQMTLGFRACVRLNFPNVCTNGSFQIDTNVETLADKAWNRRFFRLSIQPNTFHSMYSHSHSFDINTPFRTQSHSLTHRHSSYITHTISIMYREQNLFGCRIHIHIPTHTDKQGENGLCVCISRCVSPSSFLSSCVRMYSYKNIRWKNLLRARHKLMEKWRMNWNNCE